MVCEGSEAVNLILDFSVFKSFHETILQTEWHNATFLLSCISICSLLTDWSSSKWPKWLDLAPAFFLITITSLKRKRFLSVPHLGHCIWRMTVAKMIEGVTNRGETGKSGPACICSQNGPPLLNPSKRQYRHTCWSYQSWRVLTWFVTARSRDPLQEEISLYHLQSIQRGLQTTGIAELGVKYVI